MKNKILYKVLIIFLVLTLCAINLNINYVLAAGLVDDGEPVDTPPTSTTPTTNPNPQPTQQPTTQPEPEPVTEIKPASISGKVWEDNRDGNNNEVKHGNGTYEEGENLIGGISVNLVKDNNIKKSTITKDDGSYEFTNIEPGENYKVEFTYEDNKYNGQDYKSSNAYTIGEKEEIIVEPIKEPKYVILIIDCSGSVIDTGYMGDLEQQLVSIISSANENTNFCIIQYAIDIITSGSFTTDKNKINDLITHSKETAVAQRNRVTNTGNPLHHTNTLGAVQKGINIFNEYNIPDNQRQIILVTDGEPNSYMPFGEDPFKASNLYDAPHESYGYKDMPGGSTAIETMQKDLYNTWNSINYNKLMLGIRIDPITDFEALFGGGNSTVIVNVEDIRTLSKIFKTNVTQTNLAYATDIPELRLELMNSFKNMDYKKILELESKNSPMTASTQEFTLAYGENLENINLALEKRPEQRLEINKKVKNLTITLTDGTTLINYNAGDKNIKNLMILPPYSLTAIMDDELTHGATINIEYEITITNTSERDTLSNYFTTEFIQNAVNNNLSGLRDNLLEISNNSSFDLNSAIPTKYTLYDYLGNNLIFNSNNQHPEYFWEPVTTNAIPLSSDIDTTIQTIFELKTITPQYIAPGESRTFSLNASKIMTISDASLLTYDNFVEVAQYTNILGRRIYNSTPGNLNIFDETRTQNLEADEAKAETVSRVPPFGKNLSYYTTIVGIIILVIEICILSGVKLKIKKLKNNYIRR